MKTTHRSYADVSGDFNRLCRFMVEHNAQGRARSTWCIGRVADWKYGLYPSKTAFPAFCDSNAHLWFDALDDLAGVVVSESGDAGFAILTLAGYRFLYEEMLQWVLDHWGERGRLSTELTELQTLEAGVLERYGFRRTSTFFTRRFDLTQPLAPRVPLEPGFTIVDMQTHPDYRGQRILRDDAFSKRSGLTEEELRRELDFYNHSQQGPIYHAPVDLCVMAPDGQLVAGCEALIDARNLEADIERVCTHSAFRRRGLARAVIQECLYRLRDLGLRNAYITGYSPEAMALYGSLGATDEWECYEYELATE